METRSQADNLGSKLLRPVSATDEHRHSSAPEPCRDFDGPNSHPPAGPPVFESIAQPNRDLIEGRGQMATQWHCKIMGEEWGPMSTLELIAVARRGRLTRDDVVRRVGSGTWVRAELVQGLFNVPPVAETATSDRFAAAVRKARPARRSVRKVSNSQYWIKMDKKVSGPFSASELRQLAERGALKPYHCIGKDRQHWTRALDVKGLAFGGAAADEDTFAVRSAAKLEKPITTADAATTYGDLQLARR